MQSIRQVVAAHISLFNIVPCGGTTDITEITMFLKNVLMQGYVSQKNDNVRNTVLHTGFMTRTCICIAT